MRKEIRHGREYNVPTDEEIRREKKELDLTLMRIRLEYNRTVRNALSNPSLMDFSDLHRYNERMMDRRHTFNQAVGIEPLDEPPVVSQWECLIVEDGSGYSNLLRDSLRRDGLY